MADRHNDKVGNRADVWKHFVLYGVADELLNVHAANQHFVYADSHCSFGRFPLLQHGQWPQGIGQFYERTWSLDGHPYFVQEREAYATNRSYIGSWKLVENLLASHGIPGDLRLFDTSDMVAQQLCGTRGFSHSDGFDGIMSGSCADLSLVDPAYSDHRESDWKRIRDIIEHFSVRGAAALVWYPVFVKDRPLDDLCGVVIAEVRWPVSGANQMMRGCGMVAVGPASDIVHNMQGALTQLAGAFRSSLCLRDQRT